MGLVLKFGLWGYMVLVELLALPPPCGCLGCPEPLILVCSMGTDISVLL